MHLKRQKVPKSWPIFRKGTKYVVSPKSNLQRGIPLLIVLRDILKVVQNRKEAKRIIHAREVLVNNKQVSDEKMSVSLFDTISLVPMKKYYRAELLNGGKFSLSEIKENESNYKISKLVDKKMLKGKKVQLNFEDGRNLISDVKCAVNDSIIINLKGKKVEKCLPLKEGATAFIFLGKHSGKSVVVKKIYKEKGVAEVESDNNSINVLIKQLMATK